IGETSEIGDDVLLYQGVVLGGTSLEKKKRHPTVRNNAVIGAGAIVLGAIEIGEDAKIGAGSVVIRDVPPGSTVVGVPARVAGAHPVRKVDLDHGQLPDPLAKALSIIIEQQEKLAERISILEGMEGLKSKIDTYFEEKKKEIAKMFEPLEKGER
ncbi:MAG TPA: serine O-acetyltransferase, partial [bacterium]|nr:serine O-acetyltransferase [bacterium]